MASRTVQWAYVLSAALLLGLLYYFRLIVLYIVLAWILSLLGQPLKHLMLKHTPLRRFRWGHSVAAGLVLLIFILAFLLFVLMLIPVFTAQIQVLRQIDYASFQDAVSQHLGDIQEWLKERDITDKLEVIVQRLEDALIDFFDPSYITALLTSFVVGVKDFVIGLVSVFFIGFFFLREEGMFVHWVKSFLPNAYEDEVDEAAAEISSLLRRYFGGEIMRALSVMSFIFISLSVLGIKNAGFIAFFAGIFNVVPYVGSLMGALMGLFITFTNYMHAPFFEVIFVKLVSVVVVFVLAQMLDNFVIQPFIFSKQIKAHPLEIFIVFLAGAQVGGFIGMLLAIPTYTMLRVIGRVFFQRYKIIRRITQER